MTAPVTIVGGGLAGCEAAWRLARAGLAVRLLEMRPGRMTPAHATGDLAELVCSNSLRAEAPTSAVGLLKEEMARLDSLVMAAALATRVPAGRALAVDRSAFARFITQAIQGRPEIETRREFVETLPPPGEQPLVLATGPLTEGRLAEELAGLTGSANLHFYDAIAPIVEAESIDMSRAFWASRYGEAGAEGDYLNLPLTEAEYRRFHQALLSGAKVPLHPFEKPNYFEGCLPLEVMAERGEMTLAFGPLKPVGLTDPRTGERPYAVVQLRREDGEGRYLNLVGFQTKLTQPAQEEVFRLLPGLEQARFVRLGSVHRNTFVRGPLVLAPDLSLRTRPDLFLAGQISGVEGYVESAAAGLLVGEFIRQRFTGRPFCPPPAECALGALLRHATAGRAEGFQPSNVNFSLFPPLGLRLKKRDRPPAYLERARSATARWLRELEA